MFKRFYPPSTEKAHTQKMRDWGTISLKIKGRSPEACMNHFHDKLVGKTGPAGCGAKQYISNLARYKKDQLQRSGAGNSDDIQVLAPSTPIGSDYGLKRII